MEQATATITVTRKAPEDVRVRQIYISLDGKTVAELLYGQTFTAALDAGAHRLRANNTLVWKTVDCDLAPGEHAYFSVVNRPGARHVRHVEPARHRSDLSHLRANLVARIP
jgi:hypothetical protein